MKKSIKTKQTPFDIPKQPKTIKVKTLVLTGLWIATIIGGIVAGWQLRGFDNDRIVKHAEQLVQSSKASE